MKAYIIIGNNINLTKFDFTNSLTIGTDYGALYAIKNNIFLDFAVGDFDSINSEELIVVKNNSKNFIKLNPIKDNTDTLEAIKVANKFKCEEIILLGGIQGKRIEHFYANLMLLNTNNNLKIIDNYTEIKLVNSGDIFIDDDYYSFFALEDIKSLSLLGFKYKLESYNLKTSDNLCISNELMEKKGMVEFKAGRLVLFKTKKSANIK